MLPILSLLFGGASPVPEEVTDFGDVTVSDSPAASCTVTDSAAATCTVSDDPA